MGRHTLYKNSAALKYIEVTICQLCFARFNYRTVHLARLRADSDLYSY